ncbi:MAG: hypothetical protein BYD32DRAFT_82937 [Podila humilis]|nr:MAG: hypothetical protein BYD32DRAFT_82937 [Podila humilis]
MQGYCQRILTEKHYTLTFVAWAEESVSCTFTVLPCFNRDQWLPLQESFLLPPITFQAEQNADTGRRLCQKRPHEDVTEPQSSGMVSEQAAASKRSKGGYLTREEIELSQVLSADPTLSKKLPLSRSSKTVPIVASPPAVAQHLPLSPLTSTWSLKQGQSVFSLSPPSKKHASPPPTIASTPKGSSNSYSNTSLANSMSSQSSGSSSPPPSGDAEQDMNQDDREKTFKCGVGTCSKSFAHRQSLRRHVRDNHNPSGQPLYACGICGCTAVYTHPCKRRRHWQSKHPENCP